ncbi:MAG TPA: DedA family protein [Pseudoalteromonas prydzensis]|uniref:DedA family protein n=1 Tax=Pseudoalteromonas prydzensis TaxID=182141 RepID=A0A7V1D052_9GAMM|nr:YqaA family protein [Pseudoalteromonas prydzensis]HEA17473.1 DedA family protein [Pseudoalteromonas prydzensis]
MAYLTLFFTAFVSATLLPSSSEVVLTAMVTKGEYLLWLLWLTATVGNVLGSCVNYWLGTQVIRFKDRKWFPVSQANIDKAQQRFEKYGVYSLFLAWVPIIGDPLTVVGGIFKVRWWTFLWIVTLGKGARYLVVLAFASGLEQLI